MTKKFNRFLILVGALALFGPWKPAQAGILESDLRSKTMQAVYAVTVPATLNSTAAVVISLSSTTAWPHKETGHINLTGIRVVVDKLAGSTTTVKLGVINFVNVATGSVTNFFTVSCATSASNIVGDWIVTDNSFRNLKVNRTRTQSNGNQDGTTPFLASNDTISGSTVYRSSGTDNLLPCAAQLSWPQGNNIQPGVGDIVVTITKDTAFTNYYWIELLYHSDTD